MSGNDLTNDRDQPDETLIDARNVATLKPAWAFRTLGSVSATPLITGGYVPPLGGAPLSPRDVAVAAYVWAVGHAGKP
jgi:hypothetical protein